ncbi:MAG: bifunctional UDP-N-acetylglucosamine diphosphorylase/glucosamine-1-phosphate N-acetyltransferase GlmU [Fimbriimonadaceae bacterium]|nr:bifunctional UDP-N-acetylglucosamine diphosphorylase/glucosamine-1-phosphate N-acetyltransferase GlmU [Fimbriimonadaceae bacterium]
MKSDLPKVVHSVCGVPMVEWVRRALVEAGVERIVVVVGHGADHVRAVLGDFVEYAVQSEQLGTAHAVRSAESALKDWSGPVMVLAGDVPMLSTETISSILKIHEGDSAELTLATCTLDDPTGYGRILRNESGAIIGNREHKDCSPEQLSIKEINPAVYCFSGPKLFELLPQVKNNNAQGEYYLPDLIEMVANEGGKISSFTSKDADEFRGINDRWQLSQAGQIVRERILQRHSQNGVTIIDPGSISIGPDVTIGQDSVIHPNTVLEGKTTIGANSEIGPNTWVKSSTIGNRCRAFMSHLDQATMEEGSRCGPFANLRPQAHLKPSTKIGNFVEIKNAAIGPNTSISHLTYIGDASIGSNTNIGAGVITCNYDGFHKFHTEIGSDCFVGSNSTLVAPVKIEDGSFVAAGSVITKGVPSGAMAIGRGRQENKEQWYTVWRAAKGSEKK